MAPKIKFPLSRQMCYNAQHTGWSHMLIYLSMIESEADKSLFEQLYIRYKGLMYHIAYRILQNGRTQKMPSTRLSCLLRKILKNYRGRLSENLWLHRYYY